jgi:hypothetical protein
VEGEFPNDVLPMCVIYRCVIPSVNDYDDRDFLEESENDNFVASAGPGSKNADLVGLQAENHDSIGSESWHDSNVRGALVDPGG